MQSPTPTGGGAVTGGGGRAGHFVPGNCMADLLGPQALLDPLLSTLPLHTHLFWTLSLYPFYGWGNWGAERISDLSQKAELGHRRLPDEQGWDPRAPKPLLLEGETHGFIWWLISLVLIYPWTGWAGQEIRKAQRDSGIPKKPSPGPGTFAKKQGWGREAGTGNF